MSWRVVVISSHSKLECKLNYLVVRSAQSTTRIYLDEIATIILETTALSITAVLLCELTKRKIKVIFCDEKRNPQSELIPYYGSHDTSAKIREQVKWNKMFNQQIWTAIIKEKINKQAQLLECENKEESLLLKTYQQQIQNNDSTNREGHAAKVYFNALFGLSFSRGQDNAINAALNYGYTLLLSAFNREITANGYLTQIGIGHSNTFNFFNLSSDLMEPFRILIDKKVYQKKDEEFCREYKHELVNVLNERIFFTGEKITVSNAIKKYVKSVFSAIEEKEIDKIKFYEL
ncbi:MAG: type II CRISPR-associated endonuclease Cas1 [Treponemataceae bacterium]